MSLITTCIVLKRLIRFRTNGYVTNIPFHKIYSYAYHEENKTLYINDRSGEAFIFKSITPVEFENFDKGYLAWLEYLN